MDCTKHNKAHKVLEELVVARCDPSEVFEFVEEPLDRIALFVQCPITGMGSAPVVSGRNDRRCTGVQDCIMEVLGVIGPVSDDGLTGDVLDQGRSVEHITAMARASDQADGIAEAVGCGVELGTQAAF